MENRLSTLEEDLEEEQMNSEAAQDKARKAIQQADSLTTEVSQLQSNLHKSESLNSQLEKQVGKLEEGGRGERVKWIVFYLEHSSITPHCTYTWY